MEFFQTRLGQMFYEKNVPELIKELGELKQEIAELRKPKESKVVVLEKEYQLGEVIKGYAEKGWTLKHYLPQHLENNGVYNQALVSTVLVFEK